MDSKIGRADHGVSREWLLSMFRRLREVQNADFAGVGLVFYAPPLSLPVADLSLASRVRIAAEDPAECATYLNRISSKQSTHHDGFHLIDSTAMQITHLSQFISPPIVDIDLAGVGAPGSVGARFMAALLTSFLPSVALTAVQGRSDEPMLFRVGKVLRLRDL